MDIGCPGDTSPSYGPADASTDTTLSVSRSGRPIAAERREQEVND